MSARAPASPHEVRARHYHEGFDYAAGSPHLRHRALYERLVALILTAIDAARTDPDIVPTVLEIGAGHGGYTEPMLAAGARVTAVEIAEASVNRLVERFGDNPAFEAQWSPDGALGLANRQFSCAVAVSVLHHIPDYEDYLRQLVDRVALGGTLVTVQDPLWYPTHRFAHAADQVGYMLWRLRRGGWVGGARSRLRRWTNSYDDAQPSDTVEYHVVRQGVDEERISRLLESCFQTVRILPYWSNQLTAAQWLGGRLGLCNTFALVAEGRRQA